MLNLKLSLEQENKIYGNDSRNVGIAVVIHICTRKEYMCEDEEKQQNKRQWKQNYI